MVTQGTPAESKEFVAKHRWTATTFCDPAREAFAAYGLGRASAGEIAGPATLIAGMRAATQGHFVGPVVGDAMQMPGLFVVDTGGTIRYAHEFGHVGDHPSATRLAGMLPELLR